MAERGQTFVHRILGRVEALTACHAPAYDGGGLVSWQLIEAREDQPGETLLNGALSGVLSTPAGSFSPFSGLDCEDLSRAFNFSV